MKKISTSILTIVLLLLFSGCGQTLQNISNAIGDNEELSGVKKLVDDFAVANREITSEQEYYIGRAVAASMYSRYNPYIDRRSTLYLNQIGQYLALHSNQPTTFGGYRFDILDSKEINAFAAPGGLIMITKGLIQLCESEDALAAVLAHEIAHVEFKHGLDSIKQSRNINTLKKTSLDMAEEQNFKIEQKYVEAFGDALGDIVNKMVVEGYSRSSEFEADTRALEILDKAGYKKAAIIPLLQRMEKRLENDSHGFGTTHPSPQDRLENVRALIEDSSLNIPSVRKARFAAFKKRL